MINLQPYADPQYFIYLLIALIPLVVGLWHGHRLKGYEVLVSLVFLTLTFMRAMLSPVVALSGFLVSPFLSFVSFPLSP